MLNVFADIDDVTPCIVLSCRDRYVLHSRFYNVRYYYTDGYDGKCELKRLQMLKVQDSYNGSYLFEFRVRKMCNNRFVVSKTL